VPLGLFADLIVVALFGRGFEPAVEVLRILAFAGVAQGSGRMAVSALRALGHPLRSSAAHVGGLIAAIPLVLALAPQYGTAGVATATLISHSLVALIGYVAIGSALDRVVGGRGPEPGPAGTGGS
jgi:O-antigen/teichoic acid export membrane protein